MICFLCKQHKPASEFCGKGTVCRECRGAKEEVQLKKVEIPFKYKGETYVIKYFKKTVV